MADPVAMAVEIDTDIGGQASKAVKILSLTITGPESYTTGGEDFVLADIEDFPIGYELACPPIFPEDITSLYSAKYDAENEKLLFYAKVTKDAAAVQVTAAVDLRGSTFTCVLVLK